MNNRTMMAKLLSDRLEQLGLDLEAFSSAMDMRSVWLAQMLLDGSALPQLANLPKLAAALRIDPVELSLAWIASSQPAFAEAIAGAAQRLQPVSTYG